MAAVGKEREGAKLEADAGADTTLQFYRPRQHTDLHQSHRFSLTVINVTIPFSAVGSLKFSRFLRDQECHPACCREELCTPP